MWAVQVWSGPERVMKRPAEVSVLCSATGDREHTAGLDGAHVCVYKVVSGWTEYQRELGRTDARRTGLSFLKTPAGSEEVSVAVDVLVCVRSLSSAAVVVVVVVVCGFLAV